MVDVNQIVTCLNYLALLEKRVYELPLDDSVTFHMSEADASFRSFPEFMLGVTQDLFSLSMSHYYMDIELPSVIKGDVLVAFESLLVQLETVMNFEVEESQVPDLRSEWWDNVRELAVEALHKLGLQAEDPKPFARNLLDDWSMGEYSEKFPPK